ncbi:hypothetical protein PIB30_056326 [Stylosanthes scabra]|uniref:DUF4283 domain-containing protein n=1 Tax=Stylosanthes scabra TaxID=79078 RepID=A0ABU6TLS7_9FABA|nr:hypothetical protein [Stylosanthes scabra]
MVSNKSNFAISSWHHNDNNEEDEIVILEEEDIRSGVDDCSRSLLGRLMADRNFNVGAVEAAFNAIWNQPTSLRIKQHDDNVYQFFFDNETDVVRAEHGSPWLFKQYMIHLRRWKPDMQIPQEDFTHIPV